MLTQTCTLTFSDGATLTGQVAVASPESMAPVAYAGVVDRVHPEALFPRSGAGFLAMLFRDLAREHSATYTGAESGEFDEFAQ